MTFPPTVLEGSVSRSESFDPASATCAAHAQGSLENASGYCPLFCIFALSIAHYYLYLHLYKDVAMSNSIGVRNTRAGQVVWQRDCSHQEAGRSTPPSSLGAPGLLRTFQLVGRMKYFICSLKSGNDRQTAVLSPHLGDLWSLE